MRIIIIFKLIQIVQRDVKELQEKLEEGVSYYTWSTIARKLLTPKVMDGNAITWLVE
jgi:hypothetical protein